MDLLLFIVYKLYSVKYIERKTITVKPFTLLTHKNNFRKACVPKHIFIVSQLPRCNFPIKIFCYSITFYHFSFTILRGHNLTNINIIIGL